MFKKEINQEDLIKVIQEMIETVNNAIQKLGYVTLELKSSIDTQNELLTKSMKKAKKETKKND